MIAKIIAFIIIVGCFYLLLTSRWIWSLNQGRRKGLYPDRDKATMFDVRGLLLKGEKDMAIQVYAELFKTSRPEAQKAVEELERSIKEKNR